MSIKGFAYNNFTDGSKDKETAAFEIMRNGVLVGMAVGRYIPGSGDFFYFGYGVDIKAGDKLFYFGSGPYTVTSVGEPENKGSNLPVFKVYTKPFLLSDIGLC